MLSLFSVMLSLVLAMQTRHYLTFAPLHFTLMLCRALSALFSAKFLPFLAFQVAFQSS